jgi:hypothetical protein
VKAEAQPGEELEVEVTPKNFGRIAAQTAKQAMMQRIRQAEKEMIYDEFKDRAGEIVSGTVRRFERSDVVVDLGKFEATMPSRERVQTEDYNIGDGSARTSWQWKTALAARRSLSPGAIPISSAASLKWRLVRSPIAQWTFAELLVKRVTARRLRCTARTIRWTPSAPASGCVAPG